MICADSFHSDTVDAWNIMKGLKQETCTCTISREKAIIKEKIRNSPVQIFPTANWFSLSFICQKTKLKYQSNVVIQVKVLNCICGSITAITVSPFSTRWAPQMRSEMTTEKNPTTQNLKTICHLQDLNYIWTMTFLSPKQVTAKWN